MIYFSQKAYFLSSFPITSDERRAERDLSLANEPAGVVSFGLRGEGVAVGGAKCHRSVTGITSPRMLRKSFGLMCNCRKNKKQTREVGENSFFKLLSYFGFTCGHCSYMSVKQRDKGRIRTERYISIIRRCFPLGGRQLNHALNEMRSLMVFERISLVCCTKI